MSSKRGHVPTKPRQRKPPANSKSKAGKPRSKQPKPEAAIDDFSAWLRVSRNNGQLPQGCTPAQKQAYVKALADLHNVGPIRDPATMTAAFWPAEETADDIVTAIRALRRQQR